MPEKYRFEIEKDDNLETAARIISKMAHDSNNFLGVIEGYVSFIETKINDELAKNDIKEIEQAISKHYELNKKLLLFSRRYPITYEKINAISLISEIQSEFKEIIINPKIEVIDFFASKNQIKNLIVELLKNAIEATSQTSKIEISLTKKENLIQIIVKDNGCGIPQENLKKIFEPFFTTKGKATGLGLSVAYGITCRHKGKIVIETCLNEGTTVTVLIPQEK